MEPGPNETNHPVVRRRQALSHLPELAIVTEAPTSARPIAALHDQVSEWPSKIVESLGAFIQSPTRESATQIAAQLAQLAEMRGELAVASETRPSAHAKALCRVVDELEQLWPLWRSALETTDIGLAQDRAKEAQGVLDTAALGIADLSRNSEAARKLSAGVGSGTLLKTSMDALQFRFGLRDIDAFADLGARRAGSAINLPVGHASGIDYLLSEMIAEAYFDADAFRQKAREVALAHTASSTLEGLSKDPQALLNLASARRELFEAAMQCMAVLESEKDTSATFRRISRTLAELYESANPLWAWMRVLISPGSQHVTYHTAASADATANVRKIASALPFIASDAPPYLRHGPSHNGGIRFDSSTEMVEFNLKSHSETISLVEYLNRILAFLESLLALSWAIANALELRGVDVPRPAADDEYFGLTPEALALFWLEHLRGDEITSVSTNDGVFRIVTEIDEAEVFAVAMVLSRQLYGRFAKIELVGRDPTVGRLEASLADFDWDFEPGSDGDVVHSLVRQAEFRYRSRLDGRPLLTHVDALHIIAAASVPVLKDGSVSIRDLRTLRAIVTDLGWLDLQELCRLVIATLRSGDAEAAIRRIKELVPVWRAPSPIVAGAVHVVM